jgi:hypothetical protein
MKINKKISLCIAIGFCALALTGCGQKSADFTETKAICELSTLKSYYHNVATSDQDATGVLSFLTIGHKKIFIEYEGTVEFGVDASKVVISSPDSNGVITVTMPDAQVQSVSLDESSMSAPLTEAGFLTNVTAEDKSKAVSEAQKNMTEQASQDDTQKYQAKQRAKKLIEAYIKTVGDEVGKSYSVKWVDAF